MLRSLVGSEMCIRDSPDDVDHDGEDREVTLKPLSPPERGVLVLEEGETPGLPHDLHHHQRRQGAGGGS